MNFWRFKFDLIVKVFVIDCLGNITIKMIDEMSDEIELNEAEGNEFEDCQPDFDEGKCLTVFISVMRSYM